MAYSCEIMADSVGPNGDRLTTFKLTYPRIIHAEMLRHRMLSRNVASSRAIPFEKMVKDVQEDPFIPIAFQKPHKGMQGNKYYDVNLTEEPGGLDYTNLPRRWLRARDTAVSMAKELAESQNMPLTKQLCNRIIEPFVWTTELVSGTEWENFFELRCPKYVLPFDVTEDTYRSWKDVCNEHDNVVGIENFDTLTKLSYNTSQAEIHIQKIAEMMWDTMNDSVPKTLKDGQWHIPYGEDLDMTKVMSTSEWLLNETPQQDSETIKSLPLKIATSRAARISYTTLGDNPKIDYEADIKLHDRLLESKHLSCFEHCARVMTEKEYLGFHLTQGNNDPFDDNGKDVFGLCRNYIGFIQYRHLVENN